MRHLVPASQLMLGFDWPMMPEPLTQPEISAFDAYRGFTHSERAAIVDGNARRLFPRLAERRAA